MFLLNFAAVLLVLIQASIGSDASDCSLSKWSQFKEEFAKRYESLAEDRKRRAIFCDNLRWIVEQNSRNLTYKVGVNRFSDMTHQEFSTTRLGAKPHNQPKFMPVPTSLLNDVMSDSKLDRKGGLPAKRDWRKYPDVVGPIKNQGDCGSCWAFAATALIESAQHRHYKELTEVVPLSEQQLIDCEDKYSEGCGGGSTYFAGAYLRSFGGLQSDSTYPYVSGKDKKSFPCEANPSLIEEVSRGIGPFFSIDSNDEELMKRFVAFHGPIAVNMLAGTIAFQQYTDGIFLDESCVNAYATDHTVLIVGYGHDNETNLDYWIIRNSWGEDWGRDGYIYLARNQPGLGGHCLIASEPITTI